MSFLLIKVGRDQSNDILIDDERVNAQHLEIFVDVEGNVYLTDLNSLHGTFVNDQQIEGAVELHENDVVKISNAFALNWKDLIRQAKKNSFSIGFDPGNRISLQDASVDAFHLQLFKDFKGNVFANDLKSVNGTFINGHRVQGVALLKSGDRLKLGKNTYDWQELFISGTFPKQEAEERKPVAEQPVKESKISQKPQEEIKQEKIQSPTEKATKQPLSKKKKWLAVLLILVIDALLIAWLSSII